jgi:hypothetical protein
MELFRQNILQNTNLAPVSSVPSQSVYWQSLLLCALVTSETFESEKEFAMNPKKPANAIIFKKGETIMEYGGELLDDEELDERYREDNTAPYAVNTKKDTNRDCACERCAGSSASTSAGHNNAKFALNRTRTEAKLVASKNIKNGEEIFVAHGRSYRLKEPNT